LSLQIENVGTFPNRRLKVNSDIAQLSVHEILEHVTTLAFDGILLDKVNDIKKNLIRKDEDILVAIKIMRKLSKNFNQLETLKAELAVGLYNSKDSTVFVLLFSCTCLCFCG
jgi:hypothetical protein